MRILPALLAGALLVGACSDDGDDAAGGFDAQLPEFGSGEHGQEPLVGRGDIAQRPQEATDAALVLDGVNVDLVEPVCLETSVPGANQGLGMQAGLAERDGSLSVTLGPLSDDVAIELVVDGELVPVPTATVEYVEASEAWEVTSGPSDEEGEVSAVRVVFSCPSEFEERFQGQEGSPDFTPDPGQTGTQ